MVGESFLLVLVRTKYIFVTRTASSPLREGTFRSRCSIPLPFRSFRRLLRAVVQLLAKTDPTLHESPLPMAIVQRLSRPLGSEPRHQCYDAGAQRCARNGPNVLKNHEQRKPQQD